MESAKIPKFKQFELSDLNSAHTPNEWRDAKKKIKLVSYAVSWDDQVLFSIIFFSVIELI